MGAASSASRGRTVPWTYNAKDGARNAPKRNVCVPCGSGRIATFITSSQGQLRAPVTAGVDLLTQRIHTVARTTAGAPLAWR